MGGKLEAQGPIKEATIEAVVTRADGRVENLGVIASYKRKPTLKERIRRWLPSW